MKCIAHKPEIPNSEAHADGEFPQTRWSLVVRAQDRDPEALGELCRRYWRPLFVYARGRGHAEKDAEDLTQSFFAHILPKELFESAQQERGRMRSLLLRAFKNFIINQWRHAHAKKRAGDALHVSIDGHESLVGGVQTSLNAELEFERSWAREVIKTARERTRDRYAEVSKLEEFEALEDLLDDGKASRPYKEIAEELGVETSVVNFMAFKLRQRFREKLQEVIAETVETHEEVEDEMRHLLDVFETPER